MVRNPPLTISKRGKVRPEERAMTDVTIFGDHDDRTKEQMARCMQDGSVVGGVLCADGHLGYAQPVGGVIAYEEHVSVSGVGFDIGCGNMAVKLDLPRKAIADRIGPMVNAIAADVSFGLGRSNAEKVEHELFDSPLWPEAEAIGHLKEMARHQLGTVGSGNHYVDLFEDDGRPRLDRRAFRLARPRPQDRHRLHQGGRRQGRHRRRADRAASGLGLGRQYLAGMTLAGHYAYAGREWVVEKVRSIIGGEVLDSVHNHHNYAWRERHGDRDLWVVRKGATPAFPGQRGFVGGSMGDDAVILAGVASDTAAASFYSTVHGAGRVMSRTEARGRYVKDPQTGKKVRQGGRVRHDEMQAWLRNKGVHLLGGDLDEAPQAYRRLPDVLAHHAGTVKIEHTLRPFAVVMAGADVFDPFKD